MTAYVEHYQNERKQTWQTPPYLFDPLHERFRFTMDGASDESNPLLAKHSTEDNFVSWEGERVFCNPPWSNITPFVALATTAKLAVLLVPARVNAKWFHRALELGARVEFFLGRPKFVGGKANSPVDCLLLVFGKE